MWICVFAVVLQKFRDRIRPSDSTSSPVLYIYIKKKSAGWREADGLKGLFVAFGSMAFLFALSCLLIFFSAACYLRSLPHLHTHPPAGLEVADPLLRLPSGAA